MKHLIESYRNIPGEHCGSVAMRNLLYFYHEVDLPESVIFGLGAGIDLFVMEGKTPMISGRSASLEQDLAINLNIGYTESFEPDNASAWKAVRDEVAADRPVMLTGDIFYLDYRVFKYHFPAHRFVMMGFDDDKQEAYIMDRIKNTHEACSYKALALSRNPTSGFSTFNLWGRFIDGKATIDLEKAVKAALHLNASRMLGKTKNNSMLMQGLRMQFSAQEGIAGIKALSGNLNKWSQQDNFRETCVFNAMNIEKFGNGGGLFRRLYSEFLEWVEDQYPHLIKKGTHSLATESANCWTSLSGLLQDLSESSNSERILDLAGACTHRIADLEEKLFTTIYQR